MKEYSEKLENFLKLIRKFDELNNSQLLKQTIFSYLYGSPDLSYFYLINYDKKIKLI